MALLDLPQAHLSRLPGFLVASDNARTVCIDMKPGQPVVCLDHPNPIRVAILRLTHIGSDPFKHYVPDVY